MDYHYIANDFSHYEMLDLDLNEDHEGPYLIRQEGIDPKSMTMTSARYLLRKDGTWVLSAKACLGTEEELQDYFFKDVPEVYAFVQTLTGKPKVDSILPKDKTPEEIEARVEEVIHRIWKVVKEKKGSRLNG